MTEIKIAMIQMDIKWELINENLFNAANQIKSAASEGASLIILPEMFATGFSLNKRIAQNAEGTIHTFLRETALNSNITIVAGLLEQKSDGVFENCAVVYSSQGKLIQSYAKQKLFTLAGEDSFITPGNSSLYFEINNIKLGLFICFDLRFPDLYQAITNEVDGFITIASWPATRRDHWISLLKARAIENQCYSIGVNRTGEGDNINYCGDSVIYSPDGKLLSVTNPNDSILISTIDPKYTKNQRQNFPFLNSN